MSPIHEEGLVIGLLTLEQFRSELLFDLRNRSDTTTAEGLSETRQNLFINSAYLHLCHPSVFKHRELQTQGAITLVTGVNLYTFSPIPTSATFVTAIRYMTHLDSTTNVATAQKTKMLPKDEQWFMARTLTTGGPPRDYAVRGNQVMISPVPTVNENAQLLVYGVIQEPALMTAGTTTILPAHFDEILLLAARWRAELHLGYRDLAETTKLDFVGLLNEYKDHEQLHGEDWDWQSDLVSQQIMETA